MYDDPVVALENVCFAYNGTPVLENVTLSVPKGKMMSIVGPNGGGKTTLVKLILGLLRPNSGQLHVFGTTPQAVRHRIGYMPQHAQYDPQFPVTVRDVVLMGRLERHWGGRYSRADKDAADDALGEVDLSNLGTRPFDALSGGQRQRVLIARALACNPDFLLLDEPTASVDAVIESRFYEILRKLNRRMTILLVSHDLGFVSDLVSHVICVNRQVVIHPTREITGKVIQDIYGADLRLVRHDHVSKKSGMKST